MRRFLLAPNWKTFFVKPVVKQDVVTLKQIKIIRNIVMGASSNCLGACATDVMKLRTDIEKLQLLHGEMQYVVLFDRLNVANQLLLQCRPYRAAGCVPWGLIESFVHGLQDTCEVHRDNRKRPLLGADTPMTKKLCI